MLRTIRTQLSSSNTYYNVSTSSHLTLSMYRPAIQHCSPQAHQLPSCTQPTYTYEPMLYMHPHSAPLSPPTLLHPQTSTFPPRHRTHAGKIQPHKFYHQLHSIQTYLTHRHVRNPSSNYGDFLFDLYPSLQHHNVSPYTMTNGNPLPHTVQPIFNTPFHRFKL